MSETTELAPPDADEILRLREKHYNATIVERLDVHSDLARFRVRPDRPPPAFEPGQYVALGLGFWEPRLRGTQHEDVPAKRSRKLVRRAYSISCPLVEPDGELATVNSVDYLEFYITLVRHAATEVSKPPSLTPRLFGKGVGERVVVGKKITGNYQLGPIASDETVLFLSTGTGEAPHNAMAVKLLADGHRGRIVNATSLRHRVDAAYAREHEVLMRRFPQYRYFAFTTREPGNVDPAHPDYVGKQYLQDLFTSGRLAELSDDPLDPARTHVFLCGNPDMIGSISPDEPMPDRPGMIPLLRRAGFTDDPEHLGPGFVRYEKYW